MVMMMVAQREIEVTYYECDVAPSCNVTLFCQVHVVVETHHFIYYSLGHARQCRLLYELLKI